jgi:nucleoside-diphosphate-sugar epimerase
MSAPRRVLVTGASGFIGRHAVPQLLARGWEVHAVVLEAGKVPLPGEAVEIEANLLDPGVPRALVEQVRPTHLLHLAWNAVPGRFWSDPDNLDWVAASLSLHRAFGLAGGARAVYAGTCAEYDWSHALLDEAATPLRPATLYGAAKHALHTLLQAAGPAVGVPFAWGRVFLLYGPHEHPARLVPDVMRSLLLGQEARCTEGTQQRDFMHVDDVAGAFVAALDSEHVGAFNIATGRCVPLREVVEGIGALAGRPDLLRLGARPMPQGEPPRLAASTALLTDRIGFTPRHSLESGLADTFGWWRGQIAPESRA